MTKRSVEDDPLHPYERLVQISPAGRAKLLGVRTDVTSPPPFFQKNNLTNRDEFIVEYYDNATGVKYRAIGTQIGWERIINGLQKAFKKAEKHK